MRRGNFLTVIGVALITYFALTAFLGRRSWRGWNHRHYGYYNQCERADSGARYDRNEHRKPEPQPLTDSSLIQ
ncbi:MAG TPA: hypothetical protein VGM24_10430 [Puia sp.]